MLIAVLYGDGDECAGVAAVVDWEHLCFRSLAVAEGESGCRVLQSRIDGGLEGGLNLLLRTAMGS